MSFTAAPDQQPCNGCESDLTFIFALHEAPPNVRKSSEQYRIDNAQSELGCQQQGLREGATRDTSYPGPLGTGARER